MTAGLGRSSIEPNVVAKDDRPAPLDLTVFGPPEEAFDDACPSVRLVRQRAPT